MSLTRIPCYFRGGAIYSALAFIGLSSALSAEIIESYFEAEDYVTSPWSVQSSTSASGGSYLSADGGNAYTTAPTDGILSIPISVGAGGSNVEISLSVITPSVNDDSIWIRLVGYNDTWIRLITEWDTTATNWYWRSWNDFDLPAGDYDLEIAYRENGFKLDQVRITSEATTPQSYLLVEAEDIAPTPWSVRTSTTASDGAYALANGGNAYSSAPADGIMSVPFSVAAGGGDIAVYLRALTPTVNDDSVWIRIVGYNDTWFRWLTGWNTGTTDWYWNQWGEFNMPEGDYAIEITYRENGFCLDQILISSDPADIVDIIGGGSDLIPSITTTSLSAAEVGIAYSTTLLATSGDAPLTWSLLSGSLPAGMTLGVDGIISGNPSAAGSFPITVQVSDVDGDTDSQALTLTVYPADLIPTITTTLLNAATQGTAYSTTLAATDGDAPLTWSVISGSLPSGISLSSGGVLSGTPSASGSFPITVQVSDVDGDTDTQALTLVVNPAVSYTYPSDLLDLDDWKINFPFQVSFGVIARDERYSITTPSSEFTNLTNMELIINNALNPYFFTDTPFFNITTDGLGEPAVRFRAHAAGATTGTSKYPRCELRQMDPDTGDEIYWKYNEVWSMELDAAVTHVCVYKPQISIAQIHAKNDTCDDTLKVFYDGRIDEIYAGETYTGTPEQYESGYIYLTYVDASKSEKYSDTIGNYIPYNLGEKLNIIIHQDTALVYVRVENLDTGAVFEHQFYQCYDSSGYYFKAGAYSQSSWNENTTTTTGRFGALGQEPPDNYGEVLIYSLNVLDLNP